MSPSRCVVALLAALLSWTGPACTGQTAAGGHGHGPMYHFPRWSPDGTVILVSGHIAGNSDLYILSLDGKPPGD